MPSSRIFTPPRMTDMLIPLFGRLYSKDDTAPSMIRVSTRCPVRKPKCPSVEPVLGYSFQPFVHDFHITVKDGKRRRHFRAYFKRHKKLPINPHLAIAGPLLIMRVDARGNVFTKLWGPGDSQMADFAARSIQNIISNFQAGGSLRPHVELKRTHSN
ncbi:hypothetical protein R3P38DRAFT_3295354 [Favolaschia claudopus]|uniref:Uncharacterized protein n=1 Tax=Favolaschia claudopus TaxID=2862362 RepID=A0AAV9ZBH8_9AGAR